MILALLLMQIPVGDVEGLPGGILMAMETGDGGYEIALFDGEDMLSGWVPYPLFFNPAKTFAMYEQADSTLEVISQLPYTAEYTYAWYAVGADWSLALFQEGESDYYGSIASEVESLLEEGEFLEAHFRAMEIMYPGSMPDVGGLCELFVVSAAELGTLEAFEMAGDISLNLLGLELFRLESDSPRYLSALKVYTSVAPPETAELVRERLGGHE